MPSRWVVSAEVGVEEAEAEEAEAEEVVEGAAVVRLAVQLAVRLVVRLAGLLPELAELLVARSAGAWVGSAV
jgi:hypothetical protein